MAVVPLAVKLCQVLAPPVGSDEEMTWPEAQVVTHKAAVGHEMAGVPAPLGAMDAVCQAVFWPVGSAVVTTSPPASTAAHNEVVGQEIPMKRLPITPSDTVAVLVSTTSGV